jgi:hypothetical protein
MIYEKLDNKQEVLFIKAKNVDKNCKHEVYYKYLSELTNEKYLIELIENIFDKFKYGTEYISKLILEKHEYKTFCKVMWEKIFKKEMSRNKATLTICNYFKNKAWVEYCPLGFADYIITNGDYAQEYGGKITIEESTYNNISYILKTLYHERKDFREEILNSNGFVLYKGSGANAINFGGSGDDQLIIHFDASPPCILKIIKFGETEINVYINNE